MHGLNLLLWLSMAILLYRVSSFIAISYENARATDSPLYAISLAGVMCSLFLGTESLYRIYKLGLKESERINRKG